ncbi:MAG: hypothetical protein P8X86_13260 [Desulfofustis sp.]
MAKKELESNPNIHALGLSYIYRYLSRAGYTIYEVNTDPNHHFQIFAKADNTFILVAVRTAYHPDTGTIDNATQKQLIKESNQLNAIPHFAGLAVTVVIRPYHL